MKCRHLDKTLGTRNTGFGDEPVYRCKHRRHKDTTLAACMLCNDFLMGQPLKSIPPPSERNCRHPAGVIVDRYDRDCNVADLYRGASAFLILGGPSILKMPLYLLSRRGILIMSVNNCPAGLPKGIRPHVWLHTDPAHKFHESIWRDPGILKIVPVKEWKRTVDKHGDSYFLRTRDPQTGQLVPMSDVRAWDMPGVLGFHRNSCFDPQNWLFEGRINRGNDEESATGFKVNKKRGVKKEVGKPNGWPQTINTMFAALRMAFYLGIKTLYLVGADFRMTAEQPYAFNQDKGCGGLRGNASAYEKMNLMLDGLVPYFEQAGFDVLNCTPGSGLYSFDHVDFEEAVEYVTQGFEEELNCDGWYNPKPDKSPAKT